MMKKKSSTIHIEKGNCYIKKDQEKEIEENDTYTKRNGAMGLCVRVCVCLGVCVSVCVCVRMSGYVCVYAAQNVFRRFAKRVPKVRKTCSEGSQDLFGRFAKPLLKVRTHPLRKTSSEGSQHLF